jgi:hypothetical protein
LPFKSGTCRDQWFDQLPKIVRDFPSLNPCHLFLRQKCFAVGVSDSYAKISSFIYR